MSYRHTDLAATAEGRRAPLTTQSPINSNTIQQEDVRAIDMGLSHTTVSMHTVQCSYNTYPAVLLGGISCTRCRACVFVC
jgi:hypothetical protein